MLRNAGVAQSHDEENPLKSLSLPLLPKLPLCNRDALAQYNEASGAGLSCISAGHAPVTTCTV